MLLRLTLHRLPRADAMIVGMDDERLAGGIETGGLHLPPQVGGGEKLHDELRWQFDELTRAVGEEAAVVTAGPLLDGEGAEALHRHATVVALTEHVAHLVEEGREYHQAGVDTDATASAHGLREFMQILFRFHCMLIVFNRVCQIMFLCSFFFVLIALLLIFSGRYARNLTLKFILKI